MSKYHDEEWGDRTRDEQKHEAALIRVIPNDVYDVLIEAWRELSSSRHPAQGTHYLVHKIDLILDTVKTNG